METEKSKADEHLVDARRKFLANCGRFALVTPPVVTLLLSASSRNYAVAGSGGHTSHANNGFGNGGGDGVPGHSNHEDVDR